MQILFIGIVFSILSCNFLYAQPVLFETPLSPRIANYTIHATLDDSAKMLNGSLTLDWHNTSKDTLSNLPFHLYFNGFRNAQSTFLRLGNFASRLQRSKGWGWIEVDSAWVRGTDVTAGMRYIAPDDGNTADRSVMEILLAQPVLPGERIEVRMKFREKIPRNYRRVGYGGDEFFFMAHWFPKIGVYETPGMRMIPDSAARGQWNCHQFSSRTEFYSDFGVYDVYLTLPQKYVVGTSGIIVSEEMLPDSMKTVYAHAEDVHEFAWVADASLLEYTDSWRNPATGEDVRLRVLLQPGHESLLDAHMDAIKYALQYHEDLLGPNAYPYSQFTLLDPQSGTDAGGMEYPTFSTTETVYPMRWITGGGVRLEEYVTMHEVGHQYWYGMIANNEFEEAMLDEGFNTYIDMRQSADRFGDAISGIDFMNLKVSMAEYSRAAYVGSGGRSDVSLADPTFSNPSAVSLAYHKTGVVLQTFENLIGRAAMDSVLNTWFQRWRFKHPDQQDFVDTVNDVLGRDYSWYFDQTFGGTGVVDYAVARVRRLPVSRLDWGAKVPAPGAAATDSARTDSLAMSGQDSTADDAADDSPAASVSVKIGAGTDETEEGHSSDRRYDALFTVQRLGEVKLPVEILVRFEDGSERLLHWNGKASSKQFIIEDQPRLESVIVDPEYKLWLDVDFSNNSFTAPQSHIRRTQTSGLYFWAQNLMLFFSSLF